MQKNRLLFLITSLLASAAISVGCGADSADSTSGGSDLDRARNTTATNADVDAPLDSIDTLLAGAPSNDELPDEGKADAQYPAQFSDLLATQSPVKSQGSRGVCSIFSTVALMEHLYIKEGTYLEPDFSEQYLQWSTKFEVGAFPNTSGSNANYNLQAINRFGVVEERFWPYESSGWGESDDPECGGEEKERPTRCHTNGEPPQEALDAEKWTLPSGRWVSSRVRNIKGFMTNNQQAVVAGMTFFYQSWNHRRSELPTNQDYWREGYVLYPNAEDRRISLEKRAGHSILLVGWDDELEVQTVDEEGNLVVDSDGNPVMEKGFFIFKNSWGTGSFGVNNAHGDGYGFISYRYIEEYASVYASNIPTVEAPEPVVEVCGETLSCDDPKCSDDPICEGGTDTYFVDVEQTIPDNDPSGLRSEVDVDQDGIIKGVFVTVLARHTFVGDLRIELVHPDGDSVVLQDADGNAGRDLYKTYAAPEFQGKRAAGTWTLVVTDTAHLDEGFLEMWELEIVR